MGITRRQFVGAATAAGLAFAGAPAEALAKAFERPGVDPAGGRAVTGLVTVGGRTYCWRGGEKVKGEAVELGGRTMFFEPGDGHRAEAKEWLDPKTKGWHWSDADGTMARGKEVWVPESKKWVRYDASGDMVYGWYYDRAHDKWVCYDSHTGAMLKGEQYIPESNKAGAAYRWYYFDESTGAAWAGWRDLPGKRVWYDPTTKAMAHGDVVVDGYVCRFDQNTGAFVAKDNWWEDGGGSFDTRNAMALAKLAVRVCPTYDPDIIRVASVVNKVSDPRAQEYIHVRDVVSGWMWDAETNTNGALASCTQAVGHCIRATVDPDCFEGSPQNMREYLASSPHWAFVAHLGDGDVLDQRLQPGDVMCSGDDEHTALYVGNALVRRKWAGCTGNVFQANYTARNYPHMSTYGTWPWPGGWWCYRPRGGQWPTRNAWQDPWELIRHV